MDKWEPVILGPKWAVRIRDFGPEHWLRLKCSCGHEAVVSMDRMRAKHPAHMRLKEIEYKFYCRKCRANTQVIWSAVIRVCSSEE